LFAENLRILSIQGVGYATLEIFRPKAENSRVSNLLLSMMGFNLAFCKTAGL